MKKVSLIALFAVFALGVNAQLFTVGTVGVGYVYVGPKLGTNAGFNSSDGSFGGETSLNLGYQFGGVGKLGITDKLAIQGELLYTSKGYAKNVELMDVTSKSNFNYIGFPIVAQYAFLSFSDIDFYGSGGFYTNVLTGGRTKVEGAFTEDVKLVMNNYKRSEFGLSFGAGATIPLSNNDKLNIDLRYSLGITNVEKNTISTGSSRNSTIEISAIYFVDLTRWVSFKGKPKTNDAYEGNAPVGGSKVE